MDRTDTSSFKALFEQLCNWGRWGADDRIGTLNFVTPQVSQTAIALATAGRTVSLGRPFETTPSPRNPRPVVQTFYAAKEVLFEGRPLGHVDDHLSYRPHGRRITHVDAFCHFHYDGRWYGDRPYTPGTLPPIGIEDFARGIVTRGVLLDVGRARGRTWLEPGYGITGEDLDLCEEISGVRVRSGDAVFVRTGRDPREANTKPVYAEQAGFAPDALRWAYEREISILSSDGSNDCDPPLDPRFHFPAHVLALVAMGLPLIDNAWLEELDQVLAPTNRADFLLVVAPISLAGGTSSPVNPLAIL